MKKSIAILGATGSIGRQTLNVVRNLGKDTYRVKVMVIKENIDLLEPLVNEFNPELIAIADKEKALEFQKRMPHAKVVAGKEGLNIASAYDGVDVVVSALVGIAGLVPTVKAIEAKKDILLANKEVLVVAGKLVMDLAKKHGVRILPVDSEHNAIFQCLEGEKREFVKHLTLTASGGPFRSLPKDDLKNITIDDALKHPTWKMGKKVSIDCSTLMNKGFEVIEAHHLFDFPIDRIKVLIHPQSLVHGLVEMIDGSIKMHMSMNSMELPIQHALLYPERSMNSIRPLNLAQMKELTFSDPDRKKFPCLDLAYEATKEGGTSPCFLNAANETLVNRFLDQTISWIEISTKLQDMMQKYRPISVRSIDDLLEVDKEAISRATEV